MKLLEETCQPLSKHVRARIVKQICRGTNSETRKFERIRVTNESTPLLAESYLETAVRLAISPPAERTVPLVAACGKSADSTDGTFVDGSGTP